MKDKIEFSTDFLLDKNKPASPIIDDMSDDKAKRKRKKKPKTEILADGTEIVVGTEDSNIPMCQSNEPYMKTYNESDMMIKQTIAEINTLNCDLKTELDKIKASKTIRNKYNYIANLGGVLSGNLSTKIAAIRERNKMITDSNNLDIKRLSMMKDSNAGNDDNKTITDMVSAFMNTPMNTGALAPTSLPNAMYCGDGVSGENVNLPMEKYDMNSDPMQIQLSAESNPNVQTVVRYSQNNNNPNGKSLMFDVVDTSTGQSLPNVGRPDDMFLPNLKIDLDSGVAIDPKLNLSYPVIDNDTDPNSIINNF